MTGVRRAKRPACRAGADRTALPRNPYRGVRHAPCMGACMQQRTLYADTLWEAELILGGRAQAAAFFHVPREKIAAWVAGDEIPPLEVFLSSLDVIADGP